MNKEHIQRSIYAALTKKRLDKEKEIGSFSDALHSIMPKLIFGRRPNSTIMFTWKFKPHAYK